LSNNALKKITSAILSILNQKEKMMMYTHIILDLVIGMLDIAFLGLLLLVINFYTTGSGSNNFLRFQSLFNKNSLLLISIFFMLFSLKNWFGYRVSKSRDFFFYNVASRLSKRNMWHYLKDDYNKFVTVDSSVYIRKISQQPIEFSNYILTNVQQVVSQSVLIFFTIIGILFYHPALFLSLFLLLLPPVILLAFFIKRKLKHVRSSSKITSQMTLQYLKESLSGYIESNVYNKNDFFSDRYYRYQRQLNENIATMQTLQGLPPRLIEVFAVLGFFILIAINRSPMDKHAIGLLDIGVFMAASYKIIPGIVKILNSTGQIKTYEFVLDDLSADLSVDDNTDVPKTNIHSIEFKQVGFHYKDHQILKDLSFEIVPGDFAGISGPSGLGKTTIINLLLGFLEQEKGAIFVNHAAVDSTGRQQYWNRISYVKQQPFFINDSILKNVTLTDDIYGPAKLADALNFSGFAGILDQYADGIDKQITENGKNISGGQRQRLMLSRALYHDFDLLILDEPFGEIDDAAEKEILNKIKLLAKKGKMIIMVTHNLASLSLCNKIISLDGE
jgi:ABC-type multidrug transport system fused ATPase/permease subunit